MHDGGPNPKLITCGTALGAHTSQRTALFPSSSLISIPCYPANEVESNHISRASGVLLWKPFFIVYFHHHPKLAGQRGLISIKAFDCPTQQSVLLSCMMPAVIHDCASVCLCVTDWWGRGKKSWKIILRESKLLSRRQEHMCVYFRP